MQLKVNEIITLLGGRALAISALAAWIGKLVAEKITLRWKEQQLKEVETIKD